MLYSTCTGQIRAVFVQDGIESVWVVAFTCQPLQPKPVREQQMIKGAVKATEKDADVQPVRLF